MAVLTKRRPFVKTIGGRCRNWPDTRSATVKLAFANCGRQVVERFQQDVMADIEHRLSWVATVTKAAPMVGLLGTVIGMMGGVSKDRPEY